MDVSIEEVNRRPSEMSTKESRAVEVSYHSVYLTHWMINGTMPPKFIIDDGPKVSADCKSKILPNCLSSHGPFKKSSEAQFDFWDEIQIMRAMWDMSVQSVNEYMYTAESGQLSYFTGK